MKVIIGADHAGFEYKNILIQSMKEAGYTVLDIGSITLDPSDDYPDRAVDAANALRNGQGERAILICGSAVGISIAVNKFKGIRAGICHDTYSAHQGVEHDNMNVLCMGQRVIGIELAKEIAFAFLKANFSKAPRHLRRLKKIATIEGETMKETAP